MRTQRIAWTEAEEQLVKSFIENAGDRVISMKDVAALIPHRSFVAVKEHVHLMGLRVTDHVNWTPEEDAIVKEFYPLESYTKVAKRLP